jgi:hypothetical protein
VAFILRAARKRESVKQVLIASVAHSLAQHRTG